MLQTLNGNLKVLKTERALLAAMSRLLTQKNFKKISVLNLCKEAEVGRATFYIHFNDKYMFLKHWLGTRNPDCAKRAVMSNAEEEPSEADAEMCRKMFANIISGADYETFTIVSEFLLRLFNLTTKQPSLEAEKSAEVFSNFFASGIIGLLLWQNESFYPVGHGMLGKSLHTIIEQFRKWNGEEDKHI